MVYFTWGRLPGHSPFALDSLTSKFIYTETSTYIDMRRYILDLYSNITYCISEHRCPVPGHLDSVGMIMRMMTVIFITAPCTEQTDSVTSGTYRKLKLWNRRHDTEFIA